MSLLDKLFKRKPAPIPTDEPLPRIKFEDLKKPEPAKPSKPASGATKTDFEAREKAAMAITDFDEAVAALDSLYKEFRYKAPSDANPVSWTNYIEGKVDACYVLKRYLEGHPDYGGPRIHSLVQYHTNFGSDIFHVGSREVIEWGSGRVITDFKVRGKTESHT